MDDLHVSLRSLRDSGTAAIEEAMRRFEITDDETDIPMDGVLEDLLDDDDEGDDD